MSYIRKGKSIFSIVLIAFILVVLPIYAGGFAVYNWGISQVKKEIISSHAKQTRYYTEMLNSDMEHIIKQQSNIINDKDVIQLSALGEYYSNIELTFLINKIRDKLISIMDSSSLIKNVTLYLPTLGKSIHAIGSTSHMANEDYNLLENISAKNDGKILYMDKTPVTIVTSQQQYMDNAHISTCILQVDFSAAEINKSLSIIKGNDNGGIALIDEQAKETIASTGSSEVIWSFITSKESKSYDEEISTVMKFQNVDYLVTICRASYAGFTLVSYSPLEDIYRPLRTYKPFFCLFTVVSVFLAVLYLFAVYRLVLKPLNTLAGAFKKVEEVNFDTCIEYKYENEFKYLYMAFNSMVAKVREIIEQVYKQKILWQKSELRQLQSQINPHFLYNSYFTLYDMAINQDTDSLAEYTKQMGIYFQYITKNASLETKLPEEVEHARIYASFQAHRFRNRITLQFEALPANLNEEIVPKLILQPIVENAFEHGLKNKLSDGIVKIWFEDYESSYAIVVDDNGGEISTHDIECLKEKLSSNDSDIDCTGIINVHRRLQLKFGMDSGLEVMKNLEDGLTVKMLIAKEEGKDDVQTLIS